ncbi:MAG TPA: TolC family protein [Pyrinomonadaceae bacterium]|nr:TolC family protein [Pyrinomonadaceae bacterium]
MIYPRKTILVIGMLLLVVLSIDVAAQRKPKKKPAPAKPQSELAKLREEYVKATNDYKTSLQKLLAIYEGNVKKAEDKVELSKKLLAEGLIAKTQVEENERALEAEKLKVTETRRQMNNADAQIAGVLVETAADDEISKNRSLSKQRLVRTSAFTRYTGSGGWNLSDAWKIQRFFSDTFNKQLPIAVFGQGAIHERWRLDHRNAMDIQLHPDGVEGQALLNFLQKNGIPYSAFRSAIPGTATGPHIHIGLPSHRY